ncbi:MAG TPA: YdcF family protein [Candidatus Limiplasma sp.]|nr:YdcF family protein [Candidatus Limiplasma sp.]HPS81124.1 YdcF family protein [Candidatus Limiplasma sp.]
MKKDENQPTKTKKHFFAGRVLRVIAVLAALGVGVYGALIGYVCYREANVPKPQGYDAIIVLGAQVKPDGEPSVQLRWRLDKALEMYRASPCAVVVCGAQAGQEPRPEGDVMRDLLVADGVAETRIYVDDASTDTRQNMQNAKAILDGLGLSRPLVVTSDYHLPRAMEIATDAGFTDPQGAGSLCRPELEFWFQNHGREALAWVKYWLVKYVGLSL